jgi:hypothetical protein
MTTAVRVHWLAMWLAGRARASTPEKTAVSYYSCIVR